MGIPSYFSHVVREHRDIIKKLGPRMVFDNLYLDSNGIIYDCVHSHPPGEEEKKSDYEARLIKSVCQRIHIYIETVRPRNRLVVAFDGVAPVAKLNQQRERRYKAWLQRQVLDGQCGSWDTCAITPGTAFMKALGTGVKRHFGSKKYGELRVTVTAADEEGEGEHKIFGAIRAEPDYHCNTTTAIYGLDADLIMLALSHLAIAPRLYLYRETPHFIKSIDSTLEPGSSYVVDVPCFAERLGCMLAGLVGKDKDHAGLVRDYVFLCFFLGNDFLPHFPSLNIRTGGIERLMGTYRKLCAKREFQMLTASGTEGARVNWRSVRQLVNALAESEREAFIEENAVRDRRSRQPTRMRDGDNPQETRLLNIPIKERGVEVFINPDEDGWQWRYYKALFDMEIDCERKKAICVNYLEGLEWTLAYYTGGCKSWRWTYAYPYPPLFSDLAQFVPYFDTDFVAGDESSAVSPLTQLSYVLPRANLDLLPSKLFKTLIAERPYWYQERVQLIWAYCRYFWETHAILPEIDIGELAAIVADVS